MKKFNKEKISGPLAASSQRARDRANLVLIKIGGDDSKAETGRKSRALEPGEYSGSSADRPGCFGKIVNCLAAGGTCCYVLGLTMCSAFQRPDETDRPTEQQAAQQELADDEDDDSRPSRASLGSHFQANNSTDKDL